MTTSTGNEVCYRCEGDIGWITLNRPERLNAINSTCLEQLITLLKSIESDSQVRVVVIAGSGDRAFTSGADISEIAENGPAEMAVYNRLWLDFFDAIEALSKPVIASVHGWAVGGGTELSLACDFVICSESARFGLSEINVGVIPGAGAAVRLTRWVGRLVAKEILMLGENIAGPKAVSLHLANHCVPDSELLAATDALAQKLAGKAPLALAAAKKSVNVGGEFPMPEALEYELAEFLTLFESEDQKEGMAAFLEKRTAEFKGR